MHDIEHEENEGPNNFISAAAAVVCSQWGDAWSLGPLSHTNSFGVGFMLALEVTSKRSNEKTRDTEMQQHYSNDFMSVTVHVLKRQLPFRAKLFCIPED